ncbi:methyltransferase domain-containing protein [Roseomonas ludipueritiae]|uniref:Methyltransferase domain-containing protein n=2 Tax=Pseudoroseomonas ludipueritiae TaxID=198093 RepID=A0ABR7RAC8_9PROT|nr:methyltransferase domain-containing protein [Pseudoroseomonas ludipueritiae]
MALPFADASFDAVSIERTLQHLTDPVGAMAELARVLWHGGRLAALEPGCHTVVVAGGPMEVLRAYVHQKADMGAGQGAIGRDLPWLLRQAGCTPTEISGEVLVMRDLASADVILSLRGNLAGTVDAGTLLADAANDWWTAREERDRSEVFYCFDQRGSVGATRE